MSKKIFSPLISVGIQDFFDPKNDIKEAVNTDAVIMKDTSGNKKWSIKHNTNIVKYDHYSPEPDNKIVNAGFETDLSSWTETLSYTLNDQFTTDRAAGAVNGTSAEPTGGTRTVVDTNSKLSITGSKLDFATGGSAIGNPGLWYTTTARSSGKVIIGTVNTSSFTGNSGGLGFASATSGLINKSGFYWNSSGLGITDAALQPLAGGVLSYSTDYVLATVLRSTGAYYYIKGGTYTNWTLIYIGSSDATATLYPGVTGHTNNVFTADNIRIPTSTWLPTPLAYDTFTRSDGAIGSSETTGPDSQTTPSLAWTGGAISTNKNVITPSLGSELVTTPDFEGTYVSGIAPNWTKMGTDLTPTEENTIVHGGTSAQKIVGNVTSSVGIQSANYTVSAGVWYLQSFWARVDAGSLRYGDASRIAAQKTITSTGGVYVQNFISGRASTGGTSFTRADQPNTTASTYYLDDVSLKPLTLSSLFSSVSTSDTDVIADANVTLTAGTQAGLVLNLDSTSSPANFIIVYHDGTSVKVDEAVAGVYTNKQTTTVTYSAGATLRAIREGTKLRVYYNNALVGSELTMTANTNTKHGLFSTYSGNSFDNFTLWPRGSGTTKFTDAPFEELTATRDTGTKYAGSASAKLVAGGTDGTYLQSVNVGDTASYTLIAYAYTTGSAVTSADVELYYDTAVLSTSYTDMGSGWYRLTGTLTGVASAKNYGVYVKAGKTVYVDTVSLQAGVGATIEVTFENSGSGVANATFENNLTATNLIGTIDGNN